MDISHSGQGRCPTVARHWRSGTGKRVQKFYFKNLDRGHTSFSPKQLCWIRFTLTGCSHSWSSENPRRKNSNPKKLFMRKKRRRNQPVHNLEETWLVKLLHHPWALLSLGILKIKFCHPFSYIYLSIYLYMCVYMYIFLA